GRCSWLATWPRCATRSGGSAGNSNGRSSCAFWDSERASASGESRSNKLRCVKLLVLRSSLLGSSERLTAMAVKIDCPECGATLKPAKPLTPGKKVRCPKCANVFVVPGAEEEEEEVPARKTKAAAGK